MQDNDRMEDTDSIIIITVLIIVLSLLFIAKQYSDRKPYQNGYGGSPAHLDWQDVERMQQTKP